MINQLVFILFFLFSLCLFSSCTIFDSGDSGEAVETEDYYPEEEEEELEQAINEEEVQDEETEVEQVSDEEDIYYIDEEDEDILEAEEGEDIKVEDTFSTEESEEYADADDSPFFSSDKSFPPPKQAVPKKKRISYKKIKGQPYNIAGFLVNAVYIARPGENIQSISNTIFGSNQVNQLHAINPHLKARDVKVGNKIYYQSPHRPQDSSQLLFYFEDNSVQPSYHQVQTGENIRTVASQLLGHNDSWKEIWATNPDLQSKGKLDRSVTIKYWPAAGGGEPMPLPPQQPVVSNETEQPPPPSAPPVEEEQEPLPVTDENESSSPLPPPEDSSIESPDSSSFMEKIRNFSQVDMLLAGALALIALICALIIIKKRMSKRKEFDYTAANFEIDE